MFSIIILTYNEETSLPKCLENISWCDDIVVIDSFSNDNTVDIARKFGARVFQRKFDNFGEQRNYGIHQIKYRHDWVFHLDADEIFSTELKDECNSIVKNGGGNGAYLVPSKMMLWRKWLKNSATYPVYQMRFHKLGEAEFEQFGHGQRERNLTRGLGILINPYEHHSFEKGLSHWFNRHNRYSSEEAEKNIEQLALTEFNYSFLYSFDSIKRRRALKQLSFRLPTRAFLKFLYLYILRRGFLDGHAGFTYCLLHAIYEQMIVIKTKEINLLKTGMKP